MQTIDIGNKCTYCSTWFCNWSEYDAHMKQEHEARGNNEPFAGAYHGGLVITQPGNWKPLPKEEHKRMVDAGERRLGRHNFYGE